MKTWIIALALLVIGVGTSLYAENVPIGILFQPHTLLFIWGITIAAAVISSGAPRTMAALTMVKVIRQPVDKEKLRGQWKRISEHANKNGIIELDSLVGTVDRPISKKALLILSDNKGSVIELENRLMSVVDAQYAYYNDMSKMWSDMAERLPIAGILGTLLALVSVFSGESIDAIVKGMVTVFVATLYGLFSMLLVFGPISARIRDFADRERQLDLAVVKSAVLIYQRKKGSHIDHVFEGVLV